MRPTPPTRSAQPPAPEPLPSPSYPVLEGLVERSTAEEVEALFGPLKAALAELKGPRAELARKAAAGVAATEELLGQLLGLRGQLEAEKKGGRGRR